MFGYSKFELFSFRLLTRHIKTSEVNYLTFGVDEPADVDEPTGVDEPADVDELTDVNELAGR